MRPRLVFLHGGVINRHMWSRVIELLSPGADCVAIDLPGHGSFTDQPFTMSDAISVVLEVCTPGTTLVGLSLGGYVAQATAARNPDLVGGLVLSGATIDYRGWDGLTTKVYGTVFPLVSRQAKNAFAKKLQEDFDLDFASRIIEGGLSMKGAGQALRRLPGTDYARDLQSFSGPIVIANGERDQSNRAGEKRFLSLHPRATSIVIADAGHACALQQPEAFADAVREVLASTE